MSTQAQTAAQKLINAKRQMADAHLHFANKKYRCAKIAANVAAKIAINLQTVAGYKTKAKQLADEANTLVQRASDKLPVSQSIQKEEPPEFVQRVDEEKNSTLKQILDEATHIRGVFREQPILVAR